MIATNKSQIKSIQTFFLVFFFIIILVIILLIVFQNIYSSNLKSSNDLLSKMALQKAIAITKFPLFVNQENEFFDIYRVKAYLDLKESHPELESWLEANFGDSIVELVLLDDSLDPREEFLIYNHTPVNFKKDVALKFQLPILVYNSTLRKSTLGLLNITLFE
ncbi:MAG: hypothetical protein PWP03_439 [Candidatus Woesearchaeota archaeon]|nr:hypothetical protein [Candidatus Woesearchaeota archaeon]MDN5327801.1 hypothetical protein [Candidatus Woesearchaeota archaeon]